MATIRINTIPQEWRNEERDLDEVIPKAITLFHEISEHKKKVDVLTFLCHGLLPKLSLSSLEETLLCNVFPDLPLYVDKVFVEIDDIVHLENELEQSNSTNKQELLHDLLLVVLTVLKCVETCIKYIYETFQCISIHQVYSLPVPVLLIVKSTFSHCQKSEASYGELFSSVSQDLSLLFRKSFELQKLLLLLMCDKTEALTTTSSEKDLESMISVCESVLDICDITERFDGNMTPGTWKSLMRLIMKNKEVIKNHLQGDTLVSQMCSTLQVKLQSYDNLVNTRDKKEQDAIIESLSAKLLKVLKFLIKLLMSFVQNFQDFLLASTFKHITGLLFSIISVSYSRFTVQSSGSIPVDDINSSLIIAVEPFLKILVLNKKFADLLTRLDQEILLKDYFPCCYTLANIVVLLPVVPEEMSLYWIKPENNSEDEPRVSIYEALVDSCDACFLEMCLPLQLPGTMCDGKAQRMVSFYEYVVSRMSASISAIPFQHFHIVEKILLKSVLGHSIISSSIASDVWCFMARWMTADLCYSHVKLFLHWLSVVSWKSDLEKNRMCALVRRLLPLIAEEHQELLLKEYPPDCLDNIHVWSVAPVHKMIDSIRIQVSLKIVQTSIDSLQEWLDKNLSQMEMEKYLCCCQNLVTHTVNLDSLPENLKSELILVTTRLLDAFMVVPNEIPEICWLNLLDILKSILSLMQSQHFNKVLCSIAKAVDVFHDDINMNLHFARLMAECGKLSFPIGQNESTLISTIFRSLITSKQWLVHNEAFGALRRFAEVTPYTPVLEECVPDEMKENFQKFICTIPYGSLGAEDQSAMALSILREQARIPRNSKICACSEASVPSNVVSELDKRKREGTEYESDAKRTKIENLQFSKEDEEILVSSVEALSKHLLTLQEIRSRNSQLPPEVWEKLKSMKSLLDTLVKSN